MKNKLFLASILSLISVNSAYAEFYHCMFTEPFFEVFISTKSNVVTVNSAYTPDSYGTKIESIETNGFDRKIKLTNGKSVEIFRSKTGSDGMSDFTFPFDVKFDSFYGGCESEDVIDGTTVKRIKSLRASYGEAIVNYWPGEYGYVMGYESLKEVTIPTLHTWSDLEKGIPSEKQCTVLAGTKFVHQLARKNEIYAHLSPIEKAKSSEEFLLAYSGEGYCLTETVDGVDVRECPVSEVELSETDEERTPPAFGNYVFTKCKEGHYTWIGDNQLSDETNFKVINLGF